MVLAAAAAVNRGVFEPGLAPRGFRLHNGAMGQATSRAGILFNMALYYAGWLACVLGAARGQWIGGALIGIALAMLHLGMSTQPRIELRLMMTVLPIGVAVDSVQTALGLLRFDAGQPVRWLAPVWIGVMWMLFAITLRYAFHALDGRVGLAALIGAVGGPAAFYAGHRLQAVQFHPAPGLSLFVLALVWCALFPFLMRIAQGFGSGDAGAYRFS